MYRTCQAIDYANSQEKAPQPNPGEAQRKLISLMIDIKVFAQRLLLSRRDLGIDQVELARRSGVSNSYISDIERMRKGNIGMDKALRLASALGVSVNYLIGLTDDPLPPEEHSAMALAESLPVYFTEESVSRSLIIKLLDSFMGLNPPEQESLIRFADYLRTSQTQPPRIIGNEESPPNK